MEEVEREGIAMGRGRVCETASKTDNYLLSIIIDGEEVVEEGFYAERGVEFYRVREV